MSFCYETMTPEQWELCWQRHDYDYAYEVPGLARFRCNVFFNQQGIARRFPDHPRQDPDAGGLGDAPGRKGYVQGEEGP